MKLHPLHPVSVHAPIACLLFVPLADIGAALTWQPHFWGVGALMAAGQYSSASSLQPLARWISSAPMPKVSWHAALMATAVTLDGASAFGRFDHDFAVITPPAAWAVALGVLALIAAVAGGLFGGELVYRHGINVDVHSNLPPHDG